MVLQRKAIILLSLLVFLLAGIGSVSGAAFNAEADAITVLLSKTDVAEQGASVSAAVNNAERAQHKNFPAIKHRPRSKRSSASLNLVEPFFKSLHDLSFAPFSDRLYHQSAAVLQKLSLLHLRTVVLLS